MVGISALLLLIATASYASSKDEVRLRIALKCSFNIADFTITLWEWDRLSPDDYLSKRKGLIISFDVYTEFVEFHEFPDGDEAFSSEYKFYVMIDHNCGYHTNKAKIWLNPTCEEGKFCSRYYVIDLYKLDGVHTFETTASSVYKSEVDRVESAKIETMKLVKAFEERRRKEKEKEMNKDEYWYIPGMHRWPGKKI